MRPAFKMFDGSERLLRAMNGFRSVFCRRFKILAYHSVNPASRDCYEVTVSEFELQMEYLAMAGFQVVSLEDAFKNMSRNTIGNKEIVITFDDGFETLNRYVFPVLRTYQFPATVFLPLAYMGGVDGFSYSFPRPEMKILEWKDIDEARKHGIAVGSHSLSHCDLTSADEVKLAIELGRSKEIIKKRLALEFMPLAYPFGLFDNRVKQHTIAAGYDCAVCFGNVLSNTRYTDPFEMKREKILRNTKPAEFAKIVDVGADFYRKCISVLGKLKKPKAQVSFAGTRK